MEVGTTPPPKSKPMFFNYGKNIDSANLINIA